jgi:hypothetical protein
MKFKGLQNSDKILKIFQKSTTDTGRRSKEYEKDGAFDFLDSQRTYENEQIIIE